MNSTKLSTADLTHLKTTKEAAKILRVTERTVINWRNLGMLGYYKIGGRILYSDDQITAFLNSHVMEPYASDYCSQLKTAA